MNKKSLYIWIVVGVIVAIAIGVYLALDQQSAQEQTGEVQGTPVATGTSIINDEGRVVNNEGIEVRNDVEPASPEAPQQSDPIEDAAAVPATAIKLTVSAEGFSPSSFEVDAGDPVSLSVTSTDDFTHVFAFKDKSLSAVAVGLAPGETRVISFNAPDTEGEYTFYCNVPGHEGRGEVGTMIVN